MDNKNAGTCGQEQDARVSAQKRIYATPRLTRYGGLGQLTQGGSGNFQENGTAPACQTNRNRYPCASDRNAKQAIVRIGEHPLGIGLYLFDYKPAFRDQWGRGRQFGVMAQEVERVLPDAVSTHPDGYKTVDYGMLGIHRSGH